mgnify:CR=1 FL=1|jgi:hypothetical protein
MNTPSKNYPSPNNIVVNRYSFVRRVDPNSGLVLRENETVMWLVSRIGIIIIPICLLNMQLSLYGAAAEAPKEWDIISRMAALGLGFSTLILAKFIGVIVTVGQGMDTRCRRGGFVDNSRNREKMWTSWWWEVSGE